MTKENIYRLNYACLELAEAPNIQREIVKQMSYFKLPNYISEKDAFDILSYISLRIEAQEGAKINTYKNIARVNSLLKEYGFDVIEKTGEICEDGVIDLYSVDASLSEKKLDSAIVASPNWFNRNITSDIVSDIYSGKRQKKEELVR